MKPLGRGCGTCKDRRISCDRNLPVCSNCVRSSRRCQGYDVRLSWPRSNDRKRAMVGTIPMTAGRIGIDPVRLVNVFSTDIEIHYDLTVDEFHIHPAVPKSLSWSPVNSDADYNLLQYFDAQSSVFFTSVHPSNDSPALRDIVMRVALSQNSPPSTAVLQSLLALSSLHRHGLQVQAAKLKISALESLAASAKHGIQSNEIISHVSALMLLCSFEIQASDAANQWLVYISGIKNVLRSVHHHGADTNPEMAAILYWVSYHDILSKFSLRYWKRGPPLSRERMQSDPEDIDILVRETMSLEASDLNLICPRMLAIISEVLEMAMSGIYDSSSTTLLEWKLRKYLVCRERAVPLGSTTIVMDKTLCQELFLLSLLVYIERASSQSPRQSNTMRSRLELAFQIIPQLDTVERQFPLLIIGSEARSDEDRMAVLDLIARTEKRNGVRAINNLKALIQGVWAQDDLAEKELGYSEKIEAVMSSSPTLPSFA